MTTDKENYCDNPYCLTHNCTNPAHISCKSKLVQTKQLKLTPENKFPKLAMNKKRRYRTSSEHKRRSDEK
jgi:hypothetical protein